MSKEQFKQWFDENWVVGYSVADSRGKLIHHKNLHSVFEASSVIKIPLLQAFLEKISLEKIPASKRFNIDEKHLSNGSGIVNWTDWKYIHVNTLIEFTCVYSDCVTANIMIDYLGGKQDFNKYLAKTGCRETSLNMDFIKFDDSADDLQSVAITTPSDSVNWVGVLLSNEKITRHYRDFASKSLSEIYEPWFDPYKLDAGWSKSNLIYKTGSMIDLDEKGTTVLNLIGAYITNGETKHFSFFSKGSLRADGADYNEETIQLNVAGYISQNILV